MADKDAEDKPSLEIPSFGFGRKKSKAKSTEATPQPAPEPADGTRPVAASTPGPVVTPPTTSVPKPEATPPVLTPEPTPPVIVSQPAPPVPDPEPAPPVPQEPVAAEAEVAALRSSTQDTRRIPSREPAPTTSAAATPATSPVASGAEVVHAAEPKTKPGFALPAVGKFPLMPAFRAVLIVGAVVGLLAVLLTFSSLKFCELVTGTDSCGGPGVLLLVATVVLLTYVGSWLLRGFGIADAGSLSFLAVALLAVVVMVFFLDVIYSWWMVLVIPPVSMATFALAWWVTTRVVESDDAPSRPRGDRYRE